MTVKVNFYKTTRNDCRDSELIITRFMGYIPPIKTIVKYSYQKFYIAKIELDLIKNEYSAYMIEL